MRAGVVHTTHCATLLLIHAKVCVTRGFLRHLLLAESVLHGYGVLISPATVRHPWLCTCTTTLPQACGQLLDAAYLPLAELHQFLLAAELWLHHDGTTAAATGSQGKVSAVQLVRHTLLYNSSEACLLYQEAATQ